MSLPGAALLLGSYLLGAVPTGYWLGRHLRGIDIRQHGSGNLGATNVLRVLGKGPAAATLAFDLLKGALPVWAAQTWFASRGELALGAGLFAVLGHTGSVFVRFRGGKGVATAAGAFLALTPMPALIALAAFAAALRLTRIVSLSSVVGALALSASAWWKAPDALTAGAATLAAAWVIWKHRENLDRLRRGIEPRLGSLSERPAHERSL